MTVISSEPQKTRFDSFKWVVSIALLLAGWFANYHYGEVMFAFRLLAWLVLLTVVSVILLQTGKGKQFWGFLREARVELYKVIWPSRQETLQTTLVVMVIVVITALFLWGVDSVLLWLIGKIAGNGVS